MSDDDDDDDGPTINDIMLEDIEDWSFQATAAAPELIPASSKKRLKGRARAANYNMFNKSLGIDKSFFLKVGGPIKNFATGPKPNVDKTLRKEITAFLMNSANQRRIAAFHEIYWIYREIYGILYAITHAPLNPQTGRIEDGLLLQNTKRLEILYEKLANRGDATLFRTMVNGKYDWMVYNYEIDAGGLNQSSVKGLREVINGHLRTDKFVFLPWFLERLNHLHNVYLSLQLMRYTIPNDRVTQYYNDTFPDTSLCLVISKEKYFNLTDIRLAEGQLKTWDMSKMKLTDYVLRRPPGGFLDAQVQLPVSKTPTAEFNKNQMIRGMNALLDIKVPLPTATTPRAKLQAIYENAAKRFAYATKPNQLKTFVDKFVSENDIQAGQGKIPSKPDMENILRAYYIKYRKYELDSIEWATFENILSASQIPYINLANGENGGTISIRPLLTLLRTNFTGPAENWVHGEIKNDMRITRSAARAYTTAEYAHFLRQDCIDGVIELTEEIKKKLMYIQTLYPTTWVAEKLQLMTTQHFTLETSTPSMLTTADLCLEGVSWISFYQGKHPPLENEVYHQLDPWYNFIHKNTTSIKKTIKARFEQEEEPVRAFRLTLFKLNGGCARLNTSTGKKWKWALQSTDDFAVKTRRFLEAYRIKHQIETDEEPPVYLPISPAASEAPNEKDDVIAQSSEIQQAESSAQEIAKTMVFSGISDEALQRQVYLLLREVATSILREGGVMNPDQYLNEITDIPAIIQGSTRFDLIIMLLCPQFYSQNALNSIPPSTLNFQPRPPDMLGEVDDDILNSILDRAYAPTPSIELVEKLLNDAVQLGDSSLTDTKDKLNKLLGTDSLPYFKNTLTAYKYLRGIDDDTSLAPTDFDELDMFTPKEIENFEGLSSILGMEETLASP